MSRTILMIILATLFCVSAAAQSNVVQSDAAIPADFQSDGCTGFPDGNYRDCCVAHDLEYYAGGSWKARWRSDKKLFQCVAGKPKFYNKLVAPVMWLGVRVFGVSCLKARYSWGFGKRVSSKKPKKSKPPT